MSVLVEFSMKPVGEGESVSNEVARCVKIVDESGVPYQLHAMGTTLEGSWEDCFSVIQACYDALSKDNDRVSCTIQVDARKGTEERLMTKADTIESELGRPLQR